MLFKTQIIYKHCNQFTKKIKLSICNTFLKLKVQTSLWYLYIKMGENYKTTKISMKIVKSLKFQKNNVFQKKFQNNHCYFFTQYIQLAHAVVTRVQVQMVEGIKAANGKMMKRIYFGPRRKSFIISTLMVVSCDCYFCTRLYTWVSVYIYMKTKSVESKCTLPHIYDNNHYNG